MLPYVKEYLCNSFLRCTGTTLFQVLSHYIKSSDIRESYIANSFLNQVLCELSRTNSLRVVGIQTELCFMEKVQGEQLNELNIITQQLASSDMGEGVNVENRLFNIFQPIISTIQHNLSIISSLNFEENKNSLNSNVSVINDNSSGREEIIELKNRLFAMKTNVQMLQHENHGISDELKNINKINDTKLQVLITENNQLRRKLLETEDEVSNARIQCEKVTQKNIMNECLIKDAWDKNGLLNQLFNRSQESLISYKYQAETNKEKVVELESDFLNLKLRISELQEYEAMAKDMNNVKKQLIYEITERLKSDQLNQTLREKNRAFESRVTDQENMIKSLQSTVTRLTKELENEKHKLHDCEEDRENLKNNNIGLEDRINKQLELMQTINKLSVVKNV